MNKQLTREPTEEMVDAAMEVDHPDPYAGDTALAKAWWKAMHDAAPPSHDEDGVPYVDVAKEDVPEWAMYLATTETREACWFVKKPMPNDFGGWHGSNFKKAPDKYAITDQPWFLTLRRIRRV